MLDRFGIGIDARRLISRQGEILDSAIDVTGFIEVMTQLRRVFVQPIGAEREALQRFADESMQVFAIVL
jgi:hypothetical protein